MLVVLPPLTPLSTEEKRPALERQRITHTVRPTMSADDDDEGELANAVDALLHLAGIHYGVQPLLRSPSRGDEAESAWDADGLNGNHHSNTKVSPSSEVTMSPSPIGTSPPPLPVLASQGVDHPLPVPHSMPPSTWTRSDWGSQEGRSDTVVTCRSDSLLLPPVLHGYCPVDLLSSVLAQQFPGSGLDMSSVLLESMAMQQRREMHQLRHGRKPSHRRDASSCAKPQFPRGGAATLAPAPSSPGRYGGDALPHLIVNHRGELEGVDDGHSPAATTANDAESTTSSSDSDETTGLAVGPLLSMAAMTAANNNSNGHSPYRSMVARPPPSSGRRRGGPRRRSSAAFVAALLRRSPPQSEGTESTPQALLSTTPAGGLARPPSWRAVVDMNASSDQPPVEGSSAASASSVHRRRRLPLVPWNDLLYATVVEADPSDECSVTPRGLLALPTLRHLPPLTVFTLLGGHDVIGGAAPNSSSPRPPGVASRVRRGSHSAPSPAAIDPRGSTLIEGGSGAVGSTTVGNGGLGRMGAPPSSSSSWELQGLNARAASRRVHRLCADAHEAACWDAALTALDSPVNVPFEVFFTDVYVVVHGLCSAEECESEVAPATVVGGPISPCVPAKTRDGIDIAAATRRDNKLLGPAASLSERPLGAQGRPAGREGLSTPKLATFGRVIVAGRRISQSHDQFAGGAQTSSGSDVLVPTPKATQDIHDSRGAKGVSSGALVVTVPMDGQVMDDGGGLATPTTNVPTVVRAADARESAADEKRSGRTLSGLSHQHAAVSTEKSIFIASHSAPTSSRRLRSPSSRHRGSSSAGGRTLSPRRPPAIPVSDATMIVKGIARAAQRERERETLRRKVASALRHPTRRIPLPDESAFGGGR